MIVFQRGEGAVEAEEAGEEVVKVDEANDTFSSLIVSSPNELE